jgi:outer membrane protein
MRKISLLFCFFWLAVVPLVPLWAQRPDTLALSEAISTALQRNHNIRVARNEAQIARNNARLGNTALLPQLSLNANYTTSIEDIEIEFAGDQIPRIDQAGVRSTTYTVGLGLNYLLFDGLGQFHVLEQLRLQGEAGGLQARLEVENTVLQVVGVYLEAARLQEVFRTDRLALEISADRLERLQVAFQFGVATRLELLNAEVDYRTDSVNITVSELNLQNSLRDLQVLLGHEPGQEMAVAREVAIAKDLQLEDLQGQARQRNTFLRLANYQVQLSEVERRLARAAAFPRIEVNGSYGLTRTENEAGLLLFQQNIGFTGGAGLSLNLFNGRQRVVRERNALISVDNARQNQEQARLQTEADLANAYDTYRNFLRLLDLERRNQELARLNFDYTRDALRLGQVTGTQFREAQLNLTQTEIRMAEIRFQTKQAEVELYRLAGMLGVE